jgi:hypothetical protein
MNPAAACCITVHHLPCLCDSICHVSFMSVCVTLRLSHLHVLTQMREASELKKLCSLWLVLLVLLCHRASVCILAAPS